MQRNQAGSLKKLPSEPPSKRRVEFPQRGHASCNVSFKDVDILARARTHTHTRALDQIISKFGTLCSESARSQIACSHTELQAASCQPDSAM